MGCLRNNTTNWRSEHWIAWAVFLRYQGRCAKHNRSTSVNSHCVEDGRASHGPWWDWVAGYGQSQWLKLRYRNPPRRKLLQTVLLITLKHLRLNSMKLQSLVRAKWKTRFLLERKCWCKAWTFILKWSPPHSALCMDINFQQPHLEDHVWEEGMVCQDAQIGDWWFFMWWFKQMILLLLMLGKVIGCDMVWLMFQYISGMESTTQLSIDVPNQYYQYIPCRRFTRIHVISLHGPGMRFARNTWKPSRSAMLKQNWSMQLGSTI